MLSHRYIAVADSVVHPNLWPKLIPKTNSLNCTEVLTFRPALQSVYEPPNYSLTIIGEDAAQHRNAKPPRIKHGPADRIEKRFGVTVASLLQTDRHLGRGWIYLGPKHPRSRLSKNADLPSSIAYLVALVDELDAYMNGLGSSVFVLTGVASLETKLLCLVARDRGHKVRVLAPLRNGNFYYWAADEFLLPHLVDTQGPTDTPLQNSIGPAKFTEDVLKTEINRIHLTSAARESATNWFRGTFGSIAEGSGFRHKRADRYLTRDMAALPLRKWWQWQLYRRAQAKSGTVLPRYYAYFPLQVEPEASTNVLSPYINSQLGLMQLVAKALPGRLTLVIKEHLPAFGRRPKWLYAELSRIPNVFLASEDHDGRVLAQNSSLTFTISGSAGLEAALSGVPVILFASANYYDSLPNCQRADSMEHLPQLVVEMLSAGRRSREEVMQRYSELCSRIAGGLIDFGSDSITALKGPEESTPGLLSSLGKSLILSVEEI